MQLTAFSNFKCCAFALAAIIFVPGIKAQSSASTLGQQTFSACAACHGLDGRGGEHAPNIVTEQRVQQMSDEAILKIVRRGIPAAGMPGFSKLLDDSQIQAVVKHLRELQNGGRAGRLPGDSDKGSELFFGRAQCGECHIVNGRGGFLSTDLTGYGNSHDAEAVREAIIAPNKNFNPRHGTVSVTVKPGAQYRGIIRNEDNFSLQMETADGKLLLLDKAHLLDIKRESKSLMPPDYGTRLSKAEIDNLVIFLSSASGSKKLDEDEDQQ